MAAEDESYGVKTTLKPPTFNVDLADGDEYQLFAVRMQSFAVVSKWGPANSSTRHADMPDREDTDLSADTAANRRARKARGQNESGMAWYTNALEGSEGLRILLGSRSVEWPNGQVYQVITQLENKCYKTTTRVSFTSCLILNYETI